MLKISVCFSIVALGTSVVYAQTQKPDVADQAALSVFQRDASSLVCAGTRNSLPEIRAHLNSYIQGIDADQQSSYAALVKAVYTAFPCPFTPDRTELRRVTKEDLVGLWLTPEASGKLRHGPKSKSWGQPVGVPPVKCEGVFFGDNGEYRVAQIRGNANCPDQSLMKQAQSMPRVSSWNQMANQRLKITRTDLPSYFEEWDIYAVEKPFEFFGVSIQAGDLVAYQRAEPGNEINAATVFRHLQRMK
jgi:hypothetical protein